MPEPLIEDWSFKYVGESFLLRHLLTVGPISTRAEYDSLRAEWNHKANEMGRFVFRDKPSIFDGNPVRSDHEPGQILITLGFVAFETPPLSPPLFRLPIKDWQPLKLTPSGVFLANLIFRNAYHRAIVLILHVTDELAYFATRAGQESPSFFGGILGLDFSQTITYFRWLATKHWTDREYLADYYRRELPQLTDLGKAEAKTILQEIDDLSAHERGTQGSDSKLEPAAGQGEALYEKAKNLFLKTTPLDEKTARIIVESVDDAIKEFGSTNQEKKVELKKWKAEAEAVLPPATIEELRKRAEGALLAKSFPRNVILRNILLATVALVVIVLGLVTLWKAFSDKPGQSNQGEVPTPLSASSDVPDYSRHQLIADTRLLHPVLREKAAALLQRSRAEGIRLFYYETYRTPQAQHELYMTGRREVFSTDRGAVNPTEESVVTQDDAWNSPMQYGLAVKLFPFGGGQWNLNPDEATLARLSNLAASVGLTSRRFGQNITFLLPNVSIEALKAGQYPPGGDRSWAENINGNIASWGSQEPKAPPNVPAPQ